MTCSCSIRDLDGQTRDRPPDTRHVLGYVGAVTASLGGEQIEGDLAGRDKVGYHKAVHLAGKVGNGSDYDHDVGVWDIHSSAG